MLSQRLYPETQNWPNESVYMEQYKQTECEVSFALIQTEYWGQLYWSQQVQLRCVLLQVARAGRFGTKGLAITFVSDESDARTLNDVQDRFEVNISELPDEIDISSYSKLSVCSFFESI